MKMSNTATLVGASTFRRVEVETWIKSLFRGSKPRKLGPTLEHLGESSANFG